MKIALFNLGFRPFFLLAPLFAVISIGLWGLYYFGISNQAISSVSSSYWHAHEMVYGYAMAVIAGFLLTAVRNWTGIQTLSGPLLSVLAGLWLAGRVCMAAGFIEAACLFDLTFMSCLVYAVLAPIVKAGQRKQAAVLSILILLLVFNGLFYLGALGYLESGLYLGVYGGFYLVIGLILVMARRLMPFFIERAMEGEIQLRHSAFLDRAILLAFLVFYVAELSGMPRSISAYAALLLFCANAMRLCLWHIGDIWRSPLLWVLYVSLWSINLGFLLHFLVLYSPVSTFTAIHAMAYGGIGLITLGMMARVALGHTGRNVYQPPRAISPIFLLLAAGTLIRVLMPIFIPELYPWWIGLSQLLWIVSFSAFLLVYLPMLIAPRADGKYG